MRTRTIILAALVAAVTLTSVAAARSGAAGRAANHRDPKPLAVKGVQFSLQVPTNWEFHPGEAFVSKSIWGSQGAEAVLFWTGFPDGGLASPCADLLGAPVRRSSSAVTAAIARAPGTRLIEGPSSTTVGGKPAKHAVVRVRKDVGCDPGFFFTWDASWGGAFWKETHVGDTIRVWIVDVGRTLLVLEAETSMSNSAVEKSIRQIVGSIRFT